MMSTKNEDFLKEFWIKSTNGEDLMKEFEINSTKTEDFMKEFWMKSTKDKSKVFLKSGYWVGSKECYLLSLKELLVTKILQESRNPLKLNIFFCVCVCFFLHVSMQ